MAKTENEKVDEAVKLLDKNKTKLTQTLLNELSQIGMPFLIGDDNYPLLESESDKNIAKTIYESICAKFLYKQQL